MTHTPTPAPAAAGVSPTSPAPLVGCILTKNEEHNIERAVGSLQRACDAVVVIDSESTDRTRALAEAGGAVVLVHPFRDYADQRNWGLDQIRERFGRCWVLTLDADEWLGDDLVADLNRRRDTLDDADLYLVKRRIRFAGRLLRHGGFGKTWLARLVPSDTLRYEERPVNEHLAIPVDARVERLDGWLEHADVDDWRAYVEKHNRYSTLEAEARVRRERQIDRTKVTLRDALENPTMRNRFLRERIWNVLPAKPMLRFVQVYIVFGGFLDGRGGFTRAMFESWHEMVIDLKAEQLRRELR